MIPIPTPLVEKVRIYNAVKLARTVNLLLARLEHAHFKFIFGTALGEPQCRFFVFFAPIILFLIR
jgi:hypothetical protein